MSRTLICLLFVAACGSGSKSEPPSAGSAAPPSPPADAAPPPKTEVGGIPVVAALDDLGVYGAAVDAERVFVIGTSIHVAPRTGGPLKTLVDVGIDESTDRPVVSNEEELARQTAGRPELAAAIRSARSREYAKNYRSPIVRVGFLYVQNIGTQAREMADATIERIPVAGGAPEVVVKDVPGKLSSMFVDDTGITVVTQTDALLRYPLAGGTPLTLFAAPTTTADVKYEFADGGAAVFVSEMTYNSDYAMTDAIIKRIPKTGGKPAVIAKKLAARVRDMAADASHVYWCDGDHAGIWRIDHQGRGKTLVAKGYADALRVGETQLVWRTNNETLARMPKPKGAVETRPIPAYATIEAVERDAIFLATERYVLRLVK